MEIKHIQLHKKNDATEQWMPKTWTQDVYLTNPNPYQDSDITQSDNLDVILHKRKVTAIATAPSGATEIQAIRIGDQLYKFPSGGGGGSGTVDTGTTNQLAIYTGTNKVAGCANVTFSSNTLNVAGSVVATGNVTCLANSSDKRLKTDIEPFKGLDIIGNLNFVKFKWNDTACGLNGCYKSDNVNYGVIAQDSEGVIDGFVFDMAGGYKGVRYEKLIPIMAQAIKELKGEIEELKQQLKK